MDPTINDPAMQNAHRLAQSGNLTEAMRLYRHVLRGNPWNVEALCSLALAHFQLGQFDESERLFGDAVRRDPRAFNAHCFRGVAQLQLGRAAEALTSFDAALAANPSFAEAMTNRATALLELGQAEAALEGFDQALALAPGDVNAWNNRGNALLQLNRASDAIASYDRAIAMEPRHAEAWNNRGNALLALGRVDEALASYGNALNLRPNYARAWAARGSALATAWRYAEAVASFDRAIAIKPEAEFFAGRAEARFGAGELEGAIEDGEKVLRYNPDFPMVRGNIAFWRLCACDWTALETDKREISERLARGRPAIDPFKNVTLTESAAEQLHCAQLWSSRYRVGAPLSADRPPHDRLRIAYLSADLRVHATAYLIAGLFERHDRSRFETFGVSFGRQETSPMRTRLERAFDHFIEARDKTDAGIAQLLRDNEIDIAVDLKGYTTDSRAGIFASRAAPIQVNYLGFPSTMGAPFIDYIIADRIVIPDEHREFYDEKIVTLPDSYQPNDAKRAISGRRPSRAEAGLPEQGFVFCSFNNSYKLTPALFDIWMRLLKAVDGSVLWLLDTNPPAVRNLRREAAARGLAPERLVFGPFLPMEEHLARLSLADLFLDTLPCNAHTTASDALWAGVPVLTCLGSTFAGRVAASVVSAAGLPDMVAASLEDYEAAALRLARDGSALGALKERLARGRDSCPLFDTAKFCLHLEAAYRGMWERYRQGKPPESFAVERIA